MGDLGELLTHAAHVFEPATKTTAAGQLTSDWTRPELVGTYSCAFQDRSSRENTENREQAIVNSRVYAEPEVPITSRSRLLWIGPDRWFQVVGTPRVVHDHLTGQRHHLEIDVREVVG